MKKVTLLGSLLAVFTLTGCVARSHLTVGPVTAGSWVSAHEWQPADFWAKDGKVGSTLGFVSSEVSSSWGKCEKLSFGASVSWAENDVKMACSPKNCTVCPAAADKSVDSTTDSMSDTRPGIDK